VKWRGARDRLIATPFGMAVIYACTSWPNTANTVHPKDRIAAMTETGRVVIADFGRDGEYTFI
jgi:hypothetical protein